ASKLKFETKSDVKLDSQQSVFPSKTDLGMAALLPHLRLSLENLKVLADGESTEASSREGILKKANEKSVAISYDDFIRMKQTDQKEFVKGQEV
ncbi:PglZ domain-containing protein, partial [Acinetobacter baumannii]|nr:PglZ domain-containing protein [Acinetobacter baumannii]